MLSVGRCSIDRARFVVVAALGASAGARDKLPADTDDVLGRARTSAKVFTAIRAAMDQLDALGNEPPCEKRARRLLVIARTELDAHFARPTVELLYKDGRLYEAGTDPGGVVFPLDLDAIFDVDSFEAQRSSGAAAHDLRYALDRIRAASDRIAAVDAIAGYRVVAAVDAIAAYRVVAATDGVQNLDANDKQTTSFTPGTATAAVVLFDPRAGQPLCRPR